MAPSLRVDPSQTSVRELSEFLDCANKTGKSGEVRGRLIKNGAQVQVELFVRHGKPNLISQFFNFRKHAESRELARKSVTEIMISNVKQVISNGTQNLSNSGTKYQESITKLNNSSLVVNSHGTEVGTLSAAVSKLSVAIENFNTEKAALEKAALNMQYKNLNKTIDPNRLDVKIEKIITDREFLAVRRAFEASVAKSQNTENFNCMAAILDFEENPTVGRANAINKEYIECGLESDNKMNLSEAQAEQLDDKFKAACKDRNDDHVVSDPKLFVELKKVAFKSLRTEFATFQAEMRNELAKN